MSGHLRNMWRRRVLAAETMDGAAIMATANPHPVTGLVRQFAVTPVGDDFFAGEIDDLSRAYRDLPILNREDEILWQKLGDLCRQQAADLGKVFELHVLDEDPYASAEEMQADIDQHVYKVTTQHSNHPVWDVDTNVAFRIAHDILGHGSRRSDFSFKGEVQAYQGQCDWTSVDMWPALFSEVIAQSAYANCHHLFGEQKVGLIGLTQDEIDAHVGQVMDGPDADYDRVHVSAAQVVCDECGYNPPHHGRGCSAAPKVTFFCPDHAPSGVSPVGNDDAKNRCSICGVNGYHVNPFPQGSK
jgi:hypothetical protein